MAEPEAMHGAGLHHIQPIVPGLMPGDNAPFWTGGYTGALRVNVGRGVCNISLRGGNFAAYRDATESVVGRTLGVDAAVDGRSGYKAWLSGQVTGCGRGVRYTYYPQPSGHGFSVELSRVSDCAHDPLRVAG
jgi:hypothetical protein